MGTRSVEKDDRRVQRTRRALTEALIALILERGWDAFSIQELCHRADVGRSTFYTHFADKEDVVGAGFEDLRRAVRAQLHGGSGPPRPLGFSRGLLDHAHGHRRLFQALIGRRSWHIVQRKFRELVIGLVKDDLAALLPAGPRRDGAVAFLAGGFFDLLTWSLEARGPHSPEEVDALFQELAAPVLAAVRRAGSSVPPAQPRPGASAPRPAAS